MTPVCVVMSPFSLLSLYNIIISFPLSGLERSVSTFWVYLSLLHYFRLHLDSFLLSWGFFWYFI